MRQSLVFGYLTIKLLGPNTSIWQLFKNLIGMSDTLEILGSNIPYTVVTVTTTHSHFNIRIDSVSRFVDYTNDIAFVNKAARSELLCLGVVY